MNMPTFEEYAAAGGALTAPEYAVYCTRAWLLLDGMTMGRIKTAPPAYRDNIVAALGAVTAELHRQDNGGELASATNDGYSESYVTSGKSAEQRLYAAAQLYLAHTGLLYRGMKRCCHAGL